MIIKVVLNLDYNYHRRLFVSLLSATKNTFCGRLATRSIVLDSLRGCDGIVIGMNLLQQLLSSTIEVSQKQLADILKFINIKALAKQDALKVGVLFSL